MICVPEGKKDDLDEGCPVTGITFDLGQVEEKWRSTYVQPTETSATSTGSGLSNVYYTKVNWQNPITNV